MQRPTTVPLSAANSVVVPFLLSDNLRFGAGYEAPVTDNAETIFERRIYADLVVSF